MFAAKVVLQYCQARFKSNAHLSGSGWRVEKKKEATDVEEAGAAQTVGADQRWQVRRRATAPSPPTADCCSVERARPG